MTEDAAEAFRNAMREVYRRAKVEAGYDAKLFARMLNERGPLETARKLIATSQPSEGFVHLWERGRLDLTIEAQVLRPEFAGLFSDSEVEVCRKRLALYNRGQ